jgi:hypothetical protein
MTSSSPTGKGVRSSTVPRHRVPGNIVHDDENWRQRLKAEQVASAQWRGQQTNKQIK